MLRFLYLAIPLAYASHYFLHGSYEPMVTFALAALGVIPLAQLMGESTEHLAHRTGPSLGGLLNATFGNAAEMIIAVIAITKGLNDVVKASLTGSIIGNLLLVGGGAMLVGGWSRKEQSFSKAAAETFGGLLLLATAAMLVPAIFHYTAERHHDPNLKSHELSVSLGTSVILLLIYLAGLLFTLRTHAYLFSSPPPTPSPPPSHASHPTSNTPHPTSDTSHPTSNIPWSISKSLTYLLLASVGVGFVAELLVGSAEQTAEHLGWSPIFVGVILLAIIGNAAEHSTALLLARNDDMDTALTISFQSSLQIALFAVPVLVFVAYAFHALGIGKSQPLDLLFTPLEVAAVLLTVLVTILLTLNGKTNWFEGAILLALYAILALAFFNMPSPHAVPNAHPATTPSSLPAT